MASASGVCWGTSTSAAAAHSRATAAALALATAFWPVTWPCAASAEAGEACSSTRSQPRPGSTSMTGAPLLSGCGAMAVWKPSTCGART